MGFLTTITFYNDATHTLREHPNEVSELIYDAQLGVQRNRGRSTQGVGNHANPVKIQKARHADDHTLYLHYGNTVSDVYEVGKWNCDQFIHEMEYHLKRLKKFKSENGW